MLLKEAYQGLRPLAARSQHARLGRTHQLTTPCLRARTFRLKINENCEIALDSHSDLYPRASRQALAAACMLLRAPVIYSLSSKLFPGLKLTSVRTQLGLAAAMGTPAEGSEGAAPKAPAARKRARRSIDAAVDAPPDSAPPAAAAVLPRRRARASPKKANGWALQPGLICAALAASRRARLHTVVAFRQRLHEAWSGRDA
jgi:hypothetical protein